MLLYLSSNIRHDILTFPSSLALGKLCRGVKFGKARGNSLITNLREGSPTAGKSALVVQIVSAEPFPLDLCIII